jgi:hypothetical protein
MSLNRETFGLFELSDEGTVLYSRPAQRDQPREDEQDIVGRDFFYEVAQFANTEDLRRHFRRFLTSTRPADSFGFECMYQEGTVKTKITMTRGHETENQHTANIVIMDIKQEGN